MRSGPGPRMSARGYGDPERRVTENGDLAGQTTTTSRETDYGGPHLIHENRHERTFEWRQEPTTHGDVTLPCRKLHPPWSEPSRANRPGPRRSGKLRRRLPGDDDTWRARCLRRPIGQWPVPWIPAWAAVAKETIEAATALVSMASAQMRARRLMGNLLHYSDSPVWSQTNPRMRVRRSAERFAATNTWLTNPKLPFHRRSRLVGPVER
jgi:hypothetical protein